MPPHFTVNMPPSLKSVLKVAVIPISPASIYQYTSICTFHNLDEYISQSRQIHLDKYIQKPCWNCHCPCTIASPAGAMVSLKKQQLGIKRQKWFLRSSKEAGRASRDKDFGRESGHKSTCGGICNRPDLQDCSSHLHLLIIVLQFFHSIITKKPVLVLKASQNMTITMIMMVMITMMIRLMVMMMITMIMVMMKMMTVISIFCPQSWCVRQQPRLLCLSHRLPHQVARLDNDNYVDHF